MTQESYADFSIIQKYLDQKKYHDEALKNYEAKITELESSLSAIQNEISAKDEVITQLQDQLEQAQLLVKEREKSLQELNIQIHRLKQNLDPTQQQGPQVFEDSGSKKAKFSFLK